MNNPFAVDSNISTVFDANLPRDPISLPFQSNDLIKQAKEANVIQFKTFLECVTNQRFDNRISLVIGVGIIV